MAQLWGGYHPPVAIIDFTNPDAAAWYRETLRVLLRQGIDVFKTDFGEGVPADAVAHNGMSGDELHNLYTLLYNDLVAEVSAAETGRAGLVWGRSTYAGGQRHAAQWGGDPNCTYAGLASTLRGGLSMAMVGHAFWSHDMGGFHRQPTSEVYVRWTQMGLLLADVALARHDDAAALGVRGRGRTHRARGYSPALPTAPIYLQLRGHRRRGRPAVHPAHGPRGSE